MFAALVYCLDLFTMQHAQHHKSGIAWLLSGITGLVFEFFMKLLYRKTNKKKNFIIPFAEKAISHIHLQDTHLFVLRLLFFYSI